MILVKGLSQPSLSFVYFVGCGAGVTYQQQFREIKQTPLQAPCREPAGVMVIFYCISADLRIPLVLS